MREFRPREGVRPPFGNTDAVAWQWRRSDGSADTLIEPFYAAREVAAIYGWTRRELAKRRRKGGPSPTTRVHGQYRYAQSDLLIWEQSQSDADRVLTRTWANMPYKDKAPCKSIQ